jgi:membrane protease YdiL (CAAX protease family)
LKDKPVFKRESVLLFLLICWLIVYITYGSGFIDSLIPAELLNDEKINFFIIILKKLIVFVAIPLLIYRSLGFRLRDFGFTTNLKKVISRGNVKAFVILSVFILAFQYFFSSGARALQAGDLKFYQLAVAFPLTFIWIFVEAGLVEEFFFRALLQSRIGVLLKSGSAGIVITVLLFAFAHAPGLYLRGSSGEGINEPMSLEFWIIYCLINMSTAGIFLGITWARTRNLYLVIGLHAVTDLLPNIDDSIHIWHI